MEIDWEEAKKHLEKLASQYQKLPFESAWFVMFQLGKLQGRLLNGEQTQQLYDEIMSIE